MGGGGNLDFVPDVSPFGVVVALLGQEGHAAHEPPCLAEVGEGERLRDVGARASPPGQGGQHRGDSSQWQRERSSGTILPRSRDDTATKVEGGVISSVFISYRRSDSTPYAASLATAAQTGAGRHERLPRHRWDRDRQGVPGSPAGEAQRGARLPGRDRVDLAARVGRVRPPAHR